MKEGKAEQRLPPREVAFRAALAGGIAGMASNFILHPLDTVKTLRQHDPKKFKGSTRAIMDIVRKDGVFALYRGVVPGAVGAMPSSMLYFGTYEYMKANLLQRIPRERFRQLSPFASMFAAACGNCASSIIFVPKEVLKQKMQAAGMSMAMGQVAAMTLETEGISGLYRGYLSTLLRNIPSTALNFCTYEQLKLAIIWRRHQRRRREQEAAGQAGEEAAYDELVDVRGKQLAPWQHTLIGCTSGAFSALLTTPMDVIKTRYATGRIARGTSISNALKQVAQEDGIAHGLWGGSRSRVLWASLFSASAFPVYELAKSLLFAPVPAPAPAPAAGPARPRASFVAPSHLFRARTGRASFAAARPHAPSRRGRLAASRRPPAGPPALL